MPLFNRRTRAGLRTRRLITALAVSLMGLGAASSAAAGDCTKSWAGPTTGTASWDTNENWTPAGAPGSSDDVCIQAAGTYTVSMPATRSVRSLALGLPSDGTQTLETPGMSVTQGIGISGHGVLAMNSATVNLSGSTLTNDGTITATGAGGFTGNVVNLATIQINGNTTYAGTNAKFENRGVLNLADGVTLSASTSSCGDQSVTFGNLAGGQINATGTGTVDAVHFQQGDGVTSGATPVSLTCGRLDYTGSGPGMSKIRANAIDLTGTSYPGQALTLMAGITRVTAPGFTNGGSITLDCSLGGCPGGPGGAPAISADDTTLTSTGELVVTAAASGGGGVRGTVLNTGTMTFNGNAQHGPASGAGPWLFDNQGVIALADGVTVSSGGDSCGDTRVVVANNAGGAINATGSGTLRPTYFTQGDGTTSGTAPVSLQCGRVDFTGAGAGTVTALNSIGMTGNIGATGGLNIDAGVVTHASNLTNAGRIRVGVGTSLDVPAGTFTQAVSGYLQVGVDSTAAGHYGQVRNAVNATLGGRLVLLPTNPFVTAAVIGDAIPVISYTGARSGTFCAVTSSPPSRAGSSSRPSTTTRASW